MSGTFYRDFYEWRAKADHLKHSNLSIVKASDWLAKQRISYIISALENNLQNKLILDVGCAEGTFSFSLVAVGGKVVGIDISIERIKKAKTTSRQKGLRNVDFLVCDAENLPFVSQVFDAAICTELLEHLPNPKSLLLELVNIVKKERAIMLEVPNERKTTVARLIGTPILIKHRLRRRPHADFMGGDLHFLNKDAAISLLNRATEDFHEHLNFFTPDSVEVLARTCCVHVSFFPTVPLGLSVVPLLGKFPKLIPGINAVNRILTNMPAMKEHSDFILLELKQ